MPVCPKCGKEGQGPRQRVITNRKGFMGRTYRYECFMHGTKPCYVKRTDTFEAMTSEVRRFNKMRGRILTQLSEDLSTDRKGVLYYRGEKSGKGKKAIINIMARALGPERPLPQPPAPPPGPRILPRSLRADPRVLPAILERWAKEEELKNAKSTEIREHERGFKELLET